MDRKLAENLANLLERRFGPLPENIRSRIDEAESSQLDAWFDSAIDADSLTSIFRTETPESAQSEESEHWDLLPGTMAEREYQKGWRTGFAEGFAESLAKLLAKDLEKSLAAGLERVLTVGRAKTQAESLAYLLKRRFGPLPASIRSQIKEQTTNSCMPGLMPQSTRTA